MSRAAVTHCGPCHHKLHRRYRTAREVGPMVEIAQLHRELVARVRDGSRKATAELRVAAFENAGLDEPIRTLVEKVANHAYRESPMRISPPSARRASPRTRSSKSWYVPQSGRRAVSTPAHWQPWPAQPKKRLNHETGNTRPGSSLAHQGDTGAHPGFFRPARCRRRQARALSPRSSTAVARSPTKRCADSQSGRSAIAS